ncbi:MAG: four helix bundle protein [Patescibacteria group bacterium]
MIQEKIKNFTDLLVWQKAHELSLEIYTCTKAFPKEEMFCLTSQMRRCSVSITSNIAEGFGRYTSPDKKHFYIMASGSGSELLNQLYLARDLAYISQDTCIKLTELLISISKMLSSLIRAVASS